MTATSITHEIQQNLVQLGMPGSLEALPSILQRLDGAALSPAEAIRDLLAAEWALRMDRRLRACADPQPRSGRSQERDHGGKGGMHVGHLDRRPVERTGALRHDRRAGSALGEQVQLVGLIDERNRVRSGCLQRDGGADRR